MSVGEKTYALDEAAAFGQVQVRETDRSAGAARRRGRAVEDVLSRFSPLLLLLLWELLARVGVLDARFYPAPSTIVGAWIRLWQSGEWLSHVAISLQRVVTGFVLGTVPALFIGITMGLSPLVRSLLQPSIGALYPVPKIAIFPLVMLIFGLGEMNKYVIVAIGVFFQVVINTVTGVVNIDQIFLDVGKNFGARKREFYLGIALPGALPVIFAGLRLGWGVALLLLVTAELANAKSGLGYLIWQSWQTFQIEEMYIGLVTISIIGYLSFQLFDLLEHLLIPWKPRKR
jgi:ABC-type nitrate/sulfonate/bicarbonate transport system permease component